MDKKIKVSVWLNEKSDPFVHYATSTYKGDTFYIVYCDNHDVAIYSAYNIFRITEEHDVYMHNNEH